MMVVVPTSNHVEMTYGRSASDYITILLTLVGIGLCFLWRRQGDVVHASEEPAAWWWRGDVPGGGGSLAGAHSDRVEYGVEYRDVERADFDVGRPDIDDDDYDGLPDDFDDFDDDFNQVNDDARGFARPEPPGDTSEPTDRDR
jgi:hypothetical protein